MIFRFVSRLAPVLLLDFPHELPDEASETVASPLLSQDAGETSYIVHRLARLPQRPQPHRLLRHSAAVPRFFRADVVQLDGIGQRRLEFGSPRRIVSGQAEAVCVKWGGVRIYTVIYLSLIHI